MEKKMYVELPPFTGRNVPIKEIARAMGKDPHYVRLAIQQCRQVRCGDESGGRQRIQLLLPGP